MKITELKEAIKPKVPITRQDRLLGPSPLAICPAPYSICFPFTRRNEPFEGVDERGELFNFGGRVHRKWTPDAHLGATEL